jgi:hypothetical protein
LCEATSKGLGPLVASHGADISSLWTVSPSPDALSFPSSLASITRGANASRWPRLPQLWYVTHRLWIGVDWLHHTLCRRATLSGLRNTPWKRCEMLGELREQRPSACKTWIPSCSWPCCSLLGWKCFTRSCLSGATCCTFGVSKRNY